MINFAKNVWQIKDERYAKHVKLVRFVISGGSATLVNLGSLFSLTHFFHIWYLFSAMVSFLISFSVSFFLQKFWTWRDVSRDTMHKQAGVFFLVMICGLLINTTLLYVLVEFLHFHYLMAQLLIGILIAFFNYTMYQKFIFHKI